MHFVIMGCGRVGSALTVKLAKRNHSVAIIDKRAEAFERLPPGFEASKIIGFGFDRDVLEEAQIKEAQAFVAVSNGDNSNIVSARIAREHYGVPKVIARIYDPRRAEIYERLDIPTISTVRWAASQIEHLLFHEKEELRETYAGGSLLHLKVAVPEHLVGKPVASAEADGAIRVIGIDRGGRGSIPTRESTFRHQDMVHFVVARDATHTFDVLMQPGAE